MRKLSQKVLGNLIAGLIILAGPAVIGVLALLESPPWYAVALAMLAAPGAVFWSLVQVNDFWRLRQQTVEKSETIIRGWLNHTRLSVANSPSPETHYRLVVSLGPRGVSVYRLKTDPEMVGLGINLLVPAADHKAMDSITSSPESTLIRDLRIEMMRLGIQYAGLQHPLRAIAFQDAIVFDQNLTRPAFIDKIAFMFRAQTLLSELIDFEAKRANVSLTMAPHRSAPDTGDLRPEGA